MSSLIRYKCRNKDCVCDFFRGGGGETECPICGGKDISIEELDVSE